MQNTGKNVSVFLKQQELEKLEKLKLTGVKVVEVVRRGIEEIAKEQLGQNNIA